MAKEVKKKEAPSGAPEWMATYSDLVTLLMCFFVLMFAFSTIDNKKFIQFMTSFQGSAGLLEGGTTLSQNELLFDGMPEEQVATGAGESIYKVVYLKLEDEDITEEGSSLKIVASNGETKDSGNFEFQVSNESIAKINEKGEIKILKKDEAFTVFAKDKDTGVVGQLHVNSELQNADVPDFLNPSSWAKNELQKALENKIVPDILKHVDMQIEINRLEFAYLSVKIYEALSSKKIDKLKPNPFSDTDDAEVIKAYSIGITNGTSKEKFSPDRALDREQMATMLTRVFKKVNFDNWTLETDSNFKLNTENVKLFSDHKDISSWAIESVYFMVKNNIIKGVGQNMFGPKNFASEESATIYVDSSREQALVIGSRMIENLKNKKE